MTIENLKEFLEKELRIEKSKIKMFKEEKLDIHKPFENIRIISQYEKSVARGELLLEILDKL